MENSSLILQYFFLYFSLVIKIWVCAFLLINCALNLCQKIMYLPDNIFQSFPFIHFKKKNQTKIHHRTATPWSLPQEDSLSPTGPLCVFTHEQNLLQFSSYYNNERYPFSSVK